MTYHQTIVAAWILMTVISLKKESRIHNSVTDSAKETRDLFCKYFSSPARSVPWQEEAIRDVQ